MKIRLHGVFETRLQGPYVFEVYRDCKGRVAKLQKEDGTIFYCAVLHLIPLEEVTKAGVLKRRNFRAQGR